MKEMEVKQAGQRLVILQKMDLLVSSTKNFSSLADAAEASSIISKLEKSIIMGQFKSNDDQLTAFYLLLNSKACPLAKVLDLLNSTGNEIVASALQDIKTPCSSEIDETAEKNEWACLQKVMTNNIDRLSSHTRNLGMVLCFASGVGLITGKDRELIANYSTLEIDQLKMFYVTVSKKTDDAHEKLLKVLKMTNNNWALDVLQINS